MLRHGVGKVSMMDASTGMLKKAKEKLVENCMEANVDVKQAFLPSMPYADESFDAVMINQVSVRFNINYPYYICLYRSNKE